MISKKAGILLNVIFNRAAYTTSVHHLILLFFYFSGWQFSGWQLSWVAIFQGGIIRVAIVRVVIFRVAICLVPTRGIVWYISCKYQSTIRIDRLCCVIVF